MTLRHLRSFGHQFLWCSDNQRPHDPGLRCLHYLNTSSMGWIGLFAMASLAFRCGLDHAFYCGFVWTFAVGKRWVFRHGVQHVAVFLPRLQRKGNVLVRGVRGF